MVGHYVQQVIAVAELLEIQSLSFEKSTLEHKIVNKEEINKIWKISQFVDHLKKKREPNINKNQLHNQ